MPSRALFMASLFMLANWFAAPATIAEEPQKPAAQPADKVPAEKAPADKPAAEKPAAEKAAEDKAAIDKDAEYYEMFKVLVDTMDQVERNYVKDIDRRELMEAAIRGVLEKLDPYSNYIGPSEMKDFKTAVENEYGGIGIQIDVRRGRLMIVSPLAGSPAARAGLQSGDLIVEIDGKPSTEITMDEAIRRLKGEAGTSVGVTLMHPPSAARRTVTIKREVIQVETVLGDRRDSRGHWDYMLDHDKRIGYIRIDAFSRDTFRDLRAAMKELDKQKLRGLIVDLRFNPGGLLASAIEVADLFLSEGEIVSTSGRNSKKRSWSARKPDTFEGFPMAVLVNRYSASASEIVSASLQDHKRAIVIGERTWGKGSVQNVIDLEEGKSALKLTTASYKRPSGHNIHRFPDSKETDEWGVMPDPGYEIKLNDEELNRLVALRFERKILLPNVSTPQDESPAADKPADEPKKPSGPSDDTKSEETKSDAVKPDPAKPDSNKPDAEKTKPSEDETPKADAKPADAAAASSDAQPQTADRQLQKAIDYLTGELAKAGERSSANLAK